jgi:hypothetical protein
MVDEVPAKAALDAEVPIARPLVGIGEDPFDLTLFGTYGQQTSTSTVRAGRGGLLKLPNFARIVEGLAGDGPHRAGVEALATEFALDGAVEVRIDGCLDPSSGKRKLSDPLHLITDSSTSTTEDAFVGIPLKKRRKIIHREAYPFPRETCFINSVFIDERLENTFAFLFTPWTDHGMIEQQELELEPPRFKDFGGLGEDLHPFFGRGKTGRQEL